MNLYLVGMPCVGKSTCGALLACKLKHVFLDTDEEIARRFASPAELINKRGEKYFRELESQILREISMQNELVVATGGGIILRKENRTILQKGITIYLKAEAETLLLRKSGDRTERPLLIGDAEERIKTLLRERAALYESVADETVITDGLSAEETVQTILEKVGERL